ncbi:alpha/beta fold hydrolase [Ruixingdingia sedimenti]|uniref:Alpha/beta fold hydrolase n=1 Tax=Ruixingdingia sedimenti TaxID=3073604 RepID=A0ABU1F7I1_9RHOB|nr:alpha/beta fold hydrolase [Xinfangfangia sp. LG-4]MDR5652818.1 alpha/beta fold hydrolase [Xinfangfangia sp. LG-4]
MSPPRPVVLLHGWTMRGAVFAPLAARLGPGFACVAPDLPGHGAAREVPGGLGTCAGVLADVLAALPAPALVVGWSMGAAVAWTYAARHGVGRMAGLITIDMAPRLVNGPDWQAGLLGQTPARLRQTVEEIRGDWPVAAQKIARTMFARREGGADLSREAAAALVLDNDPARIAPYWDEMLAMDLRPAIPALRLPYLVAHGGQSRVYPAAAAEWLAATAPQARRLAFAASGHSPHLEEPETFAAAIRDFAAAL